MDREVADAIAELKVKESQWQLIRLASMPMSI